MSCAEWLLACSRHFNFKYCNYKHILYNYAHLLLYRNPHCMLEEPSEGKSANDSNTLLDTSTVQRAYVPISMHIKLVFLLLSGAVGCNSVCTNGTSELSLFVVWRAGNAATRYLHVPSFCNTCVITLPPAMVSKLVSKQRNCEQ